MARNRTLILTTGTSYQWPVLAPFFVSLQRTGYQGDVCMLVEDKWLTPSDYAQFQKAGARTLGIYPLLSRIPARLRNVRFDPRLGWLHRGLPWLAGILPVSSYRRRRCLDLTGTWLHPIMSARLFFYRRLLDECARHYDNVILCDVRDVIFQTAPDLWNSEFSLNVFLEQPLATLASEPNNARWIRLLYGDDALSELGSSRVSCAGVVHGTTQGIITYLDEMTKALIPQTTCIAGENSFDQGVHNYLLYSGNLSDAHIWENGDGLVLNMCGVDANQYQPDKDGVIRTASGGIIPLIHQYDRHPALNDHMLSGLGLTRPH
ncbi:MAG TPA: hypothetical protein VL357_06155 [Rariglobus sp.]|jgi:hypothetical protein|nr:hypothetical protein [Rariglobus sp.]